MKINVTHKTFREFGLTDNEITVYLESIKHERSTPYTLSKTLNIPRTTIYDILLSLSLKGLVVLEQSDGIQKQQTVVKAKNPYVIREILAKRRKKLFELEANIIQFLPNLRKDYLKNDISPHVEFHDGIEGMKKVYLGDNELIGKYEALAFENLMPVDVMTHDVINKDIDKATNKNSGESIPTRDIVVLNDWTKHVFSYQYNRNNHYFDKRLMRYVEDIVPPFTGRVAIIADTIRITTSSEDEAWGMIIHSKSLSSTLKSIFEIIWVQAKPVTVDFVKSLGPNYLLEAVEKIENEKDNK